MYYTIDRHIEKDGHESIAPSHVIFSDKQDVDKIVDMLVDDDVHYVDVAYEGKFIHELTTEGMGNHTWKKLSFVNPYTTEVLYIIRYKKSTLWLLELEEE